MDPIQFRHAQVGVGASSLHVVEVGDPDAPAVLFLHGWPQSHRAWRAVLADMISVVKFSDLEYRITEIEEQLSARTGHTNQAR